MSLLLASRRWAGRRSVQACAVLIAACAIPAGNASAQPVGCSLTTLTDPPRDLLDCKNGLSLSAEKSAAYKLVDRNRDGQPEAVEVASKGVLIEWSGRQRGGFQVLTPHAIASVRGTTWAVDVKPTATSVFVQIGKVRVVRPQGGATGGVVLGAGDGVDVSAGGAPLERKVWPRERALHLLARFGR